MRVIHRASLVFLLKDIYSKAPITTAEILCDGKQNPYTRKKDGYYVFSNLYPQEYLISISCVGYVPMEFKVNLRENETQVIPITMPYSVDNEAMRKITHFSIDIIHRKKQFFSRTITRIKSGQSKIIFRILFQIYIFIQRRKKNVEFCNLR